MKKLFHEDDDKYTDAAITIASEFSDCVKKYFEEKIKEGYSIRELEYVMQKELENIACYFMIIKFDN